MAQKPRFQRGMDLETRLQFIRSKCRPYHRPNPILKTKQGITGPMGKGGGFRGHFGIILPGHTTHTMAWVKEQDKAVSRPCRSLRKKRVSPLTKIAEQLPKKLPKLDVVAK